MYELVCMVLRRSHAFSVSVEAHPTASGIRTEAVAEKEVITPWKDMREVLGAGDPIVVIDSLSA